MKVHTTAAPALGFGTPLNPAAAVRFNNVGSGTVISHVQSVAGVHHGIDVVGGAPHIAHAAVTKAQGSGFRITAGSQVSGQFWLTNALTGTDWVSGVIVLGAHPTWRTSRSWVTLKPGERRAALDSPVGPGAPTAQFAERRATKPMPRRPLRSS